MEAASLKKEPRQTEATIKANDEGTRSGGKETPIAECSITRWGLRRDGLCEAEMEAASLKKEPRQIETTTSCNYVAHGQAQGNIGARM